MGTRRTNTGDRKVGELATATGLTVRTLHYYDEIGLLVPSARTHGGHRLYSAVDVERLYRICLLRRLGLSLEEVSKALDEPRWSLRDSIGRHLDDLDRRIEAAVQLRSQLIHVAESLDADDATPTEDLLDVLGRMTMLGDALQRRISIVVYADLQAAHDYLVNVFGFGPGHLARDDQGHIIHAEVHAGDGVVWLHRESPDFGLASPRSAGLATASMAVIVEDVDAHFQHAVQHGATIEYEPVDQPYGYREYSARDIEGGLWSFMKPLD
jgi:DNA-binding transcriptional MerR regulator